MPFTSSSSARLSPAQNYDRLLRLQKVSELLDSRWSIPGTRWRIGLDGIASVVPGLGDTLTAAVSAWIIYEAARFGIPKWVLLRMLGNVGVDWAVGSIPVIGTLFDIGFKANLRNLDLLHRHLERGYMS